MIKHTKLIGLIGLIGLISSIESIAFAQSAPEFLVSWRANSYVPADYQGKILPSKSSQVEAGFDLIDKNKIADLSKNNISWFLNGNLIASGISRKTADFPINGNLNQNVRITVSGYKENDLDHTFFLPIAEPEAVINAKIPYRTIRNQNWLPFQNHTLEARPFFFNISDLNQLLFKWRVNDQLIKNAPENTSLLKLNLESGGTPRETALTISLSASNLLNQLELASKLINFIVK